MHLHDGGMVQAGQKPPAIEFYDSSKLTSMDEFYRKHNANPRRSSLLKCWGRVHLDLC